MLFRRYLVMQNIDGIDALRMAEDVSNHKGGSFHVCFYPCNRTKNSASSSLRLIEYCTYRPQLPRNKFDIDADNFFLFKDKDNYPKTCYRLLLRYIAFPPDFKMRKVNWL